jgi:transposase
VAGWNAWTARSTEEKLSELHTAEGTLLPENTREELRRDIARLRIVREHLKEIEQQRLRKLKTATPAAKGRHAMIHLIARVIGIGIETADMLVNEILSRHLRDSKAVARYAGLTGSPDESGKRRREKGLARAGNARVRRGMINWPGASSGSRKTACLLSGSALGRPTDAAAHARR